MCLSNVPKNRCQLSATGDNVGITHFHITAHWAQYMAYISVPAVSSGSVVQWLERRTFGTKDPNANGSGFKTRQRQHFFFFKTCICHAFCIQEHGKCIVQQDSTCSTRVLWIMAASKGNLPDLYLTVQAETCIFQSRISQKRCVALI